MKNAQRRTSAGQALCYLLAVLLLGCSGSPTRQHSELLQLARQADANYRSGKFDVARKQYEKLVSANPKYVPGLVRLGVIAYRDGDAKSAQVRFELAVQLDPHNQQAKYNLAMLRLHEARTLLDDYVELAPQAANRQQVLVLLSRLREFGAGP